MEYLSDFLARVSVDPINSDDNYYFYSKFDLFPGCIKGGGYVLGAFNLELYSISLDGSNPRNSVPSCGIYNNIVDNYDYIIGRLE